MEEEKYGAILVIPEGMDRDTSEFQQFEKDVEMLVNCINNFMEKKDDK